MISNPTHSPTTGSFPLGLVPRTAPNQPAPNQPAPSATVPDQPPQRDVVKIWDVPFDRVDMSGAIDRIDALVARRDPSYVITANVNYCMLHDKDDAVRRITAGASLILADGQPIVWRSRLSDQPLPERVAGSEMIGHLCQRAGQKGYRVYFLGGVEGVASAAAAACKRQYPALQIAGVESPPFRDLTADEQADQDCRIRDSGTDILLVAFGQPKGEKWIAEHHRRIGVPVSIQLGASFDFLAGTARRAPEKLQKMGLEWAHRMLSDPKRLVPRYASNASFLAAALVDDWRRQVTRWGMGQWTPSPASPPAMTDRRRRAT